MCLSFHVIRRIGNHIMWWCVVKSEEFVNLKKPWKRVSTFEFWYLHKFPLSYRHNGLMKGVFFFGCTWKLVRMAWWILCELGFGLWWARWYIYMGLWFLVDGYRLMYGGFENNLLCVLILVLAGCGFLRWEGWVWLLVEMRWYFKWICWLWYQMLWTEKLKR